MHTLVWLNPLFKVLKWIENGVENLYIERMEKYPLYLEDTLKNIVGACRGG
jgi:hypothetical protein